MIVLLSISVVMSTFNVQVAKAGVADWWPMFHYDTDHTGYTTSTAPSTNKIQWVYGLGTSFESSPAVSGGVVYIGSDDGNVYAINATTGLKIWNYQTGGPVVSSPCIFLNLVIVGSDDGGVYGLNAQTGADVWIFFTGGKVESSPTLAYLYGIPFIYVISNDNNGLYCLTPMGQLVWNTNIYANWILYRSSPAVYVDPEGVNNLVYVTEWPDGMEAYNAQTGALVWEVGTDQIQYGSSTSWSYNGNEACSPAYAYGMVYAGIAYFFIAWNYATGSIVPTGGNPKLAIPEWDRPIGGEIEGSPAVGFNGFVYIGSDDGCLYALNEVTGLVGWKYQTGNKIVSSPAVAGGIVFVGSYDGDVYALNALSGTLIWSYNTMGIVFSSPAVVDGVVYVGSSNGVYAFGPTDDVATTNVVPMKTVLCQGYTMNYSVTVAVPGSYAESFSEIVYVHRFGLYNPTIQIASQAFFMVSGGSLTLTFVWNADDLIKGDYTIKAYAPPVPGETLYNTANNLYMYSFIHLSMPGDITGSATFIPDGKVDGRDITAVAKCFGSGLGSPRYNANCDINNDGKVDARDITIVAKNYGKLDP